jgi:energy-coupling factor transporter ATP-binding protein EcfA2
MDGTGTRIQVDRVVGQFIVDNHYVTVHATEQSVVNLVTTGQRPQPQRRDAIALLPRQQAAPIGRERELDELRRAVSAGHVVELYGAPGAGKSTLIRHAANDIAAHSGNVVFLPAANRDAADILQDVFEACYRTEGYRPGPVEVRQLLGDLDIRLVLDDLDVSDDQHTELADALRHATVLFASTRRQIWPDGSSIPLVGLTDTAALTLLMHALGRPLADDELPLATELWRATNGSPLLLLRAASAARLDTYGVMRLPRPTDLDGLLPAVIAGLSAPAREIAAVLTFAGITGVSVDLLPWLVTDALTVTSALAELATVGVAIESAIGATLAPGIDATPQSPLAPGVPQLSWLADRLRHWAGTPGTPPMAVADHVTLITGLIDATVLIGRPDLGAWLARATAPLAACSLRLGTWEQILAHGKVAAERAGDRAALAYLTHEDGVRHLITGRRVIAAGLIAGAAAMWHQIGDLAHAALASHTQAITGVASPATHIAGHATVVHSAGHATAGHMAAGAKTAVLGTKGAVAAKAGLGLGAKIAIASTATAVVVGGAVVGVKIATAPHQAAPPPVTTTQPRPVPQPTGTQLARYLLPVTEIPSNFPHGQATSLTDSGNSLLTRPNETRGAATCPVGGTSDVSVGESAFAISGSTENASDFIGEIYYYQEVIQFSNVADAAMVFGRYRAELALCPTLATGTTVGSNIDAPSIDGHRTIATEYKPSGGDYLQAISYVLDGTNIYGVGYSMKIQIVNIAKPRPTIDPSISGELPGLVKKLIGSEAVAYTNPPPNTPATTTPATTEQPPTTAATPTAQSTDSGPAGVVQSYYAAITRQDYQTAWNLGGQNVGGETYQQFVAGYAGTAQDVVTNVSVQGSTVTADLTATQTDGSQQTYHGTYTVNGNTITHFTVQRTG